MKTCMKQLLLLAMIFATITATGSNTPQQQSKSGATQEFKAAVKALLDATEYEKTMKERMVSAYKQLGQEDNPYIDDFMNQLIEKMPDKMVDIYSKYFTLDEIKQLTEINKTEIQTNEIKQAIALAKTPCLKKFNEKTIAITQDILEVT